MTGITMYLSIITLNVNGLNSPIKRHHLANWIKKEDSTICGLQEIHLIDRNKYWLRVKGWKIYQANGPWKQARVAILISDKVYFKLTIFKWDKEGHSILIKVEIHQKEITIINLYATNVNVHNFINHTLKDLKTYINSNTVVVREFNTPLSSVDRSSKQTINKEILDLYHTINHMDLVNVYRIFHPSSAQYTFFWAAQGPFSKTDHILEPKEKASANIRKEK
jgi:exonuclease III